MVSNSDSTANSDSNSFTPSERVAVSSLAFLFSVRMLGLFMVMPIISVYGQALDGATPLLLGLAMGIYGLTQALLQIPFGWSSDQLGRKPVILFGLALFAVGGLVAANSESVYWLILGRALQGAGAVSSTIMALLTDLTREQVRSKSMAFMGASIGLSFSLALVLGPALASGLGLSGVFYLIAALGLVGMIICHTLVPTPKQMRRHRDVRPDLKDIQSVLFHPELSKINIGVFTLHAAMTAFFLVVPRMLTEQLGVAIESHWKLYLPVLFLSFFLMVPFIIVAEKYRQMHRVLVGMVFFLIASQLVFLLGGNQMMVWLAAVLIYFIGFNTLEALLPSWLSKLAPAGKRGTCMGVFSSSQFLGAFFGGWGAGMLMTWLGAQGVFIGLVVIFSMWVLVALKMKPPAYLKSFSVSFLDSAVADHSELEHALGQLPGVQEVILYVTEREAYLKVDPQQFTKESLEALRDFNLSY